MAEFAVGETYRPRPRQLDNPSLADKMVRRSITRDEIDTVLSDNEIIEVYEHRDRVRYVLLGNVRGRTLHVVVAEDDIVGATVVLSVYQPDVTHGWDRATGFRRRKEDPDGR